MKRLWLIGMMGVGKTSVGKAAAEVLGVPFSDSDSLVEEQMGRSITEVWARDGEEAFRAVESAVIADLSTGEGIIATGGGAVIDPRSRQLIVGDVVWLEASVDTIRDRLGDVSERPLLAGDDLSAELARLLEERAPAYLSLASHRIVTDHQGVEEVAGNVVAVWNA